MTARSPFPGMDPYLEARWYDVHVKFLAFLGEGLQAKLPPALRARSEQSVFVEEEDQRPRLIRPDVAVTRRQPEVEEGGVATLVEAPPATRVEPITVRLFEPPEFDRWVQIIDRTSGDRVVTVIEVLSPWNKFFGHANVKYLNKLNSYVLGGVNIVEIDLLRSSRNELHVSEHYIPTERRTAYYTSVARTWGETDWQVFPMSLRQALPPIPVPLRKQDGDVWLGLQPLIDRVYAAGGHDDIDYSKPPVPVLSSDEEAWADALLREAKRR